MFFYLLLSIIYFQFVTHSYCSLLAMNLLQISSRKSTPEMFPCDGSEREKQEFRRKLSVAVVEYVFPVLSGVETLLKSENNDHSQFCCDNDEGKKQAYNLICFYVTLMFRGDGPVLQSLL